MLTPAQIEARKGKLTASRVAVLMSDNYSDIMDLYLEMIGEKQPDSLDHIWPVRLGSHTESLHLDWLSETTRSPIFKRGDVVTHYQHDWAAATLDGWVDDVGCIFPRYGRSGPAPVEVKHTGGRETLDIVTQRYMPQMHWQMIVTVTSHCMFSVIMGGNEPIPELIQRDEEYADELFKRAVQFMEFVKRRQPPVVLPPIEPPIVPTRVVDMSRSNSWVAPALFWLEHHETAKSCSRAEKELKELVPPDAKQAHGHGVVITVDRAGRKSLRPDDDYLAF